MRPAFVAVLCLAAACDEPAPKDVSPVTPIPGLPPPPVKPAVRPDPLPAPAPPAPVVDEEQEQLFNGPRRATANRIDAGTPSKADLAGAFEVRESTSNGRSGSSQTSILKGDLRGATASFTEKHTFGQAHESSTFKVSASDVSAFLGELDALEWWTLGNEGIDMADGSGIEVSIRRGARTHTWGVDNQCGCTYPCACPQLAVGQKLAALIDAERARAHAKAPAPTVETFAAPVVTGKAVRCSKKTCEDVRCFPQGNALACFKDPFDRTAGVLISPEKGFPAPHRPGKDKEALWAFELENGITCVHKASPRSHWNCDAGRTFHSDKDLAFESRGKAKVVRFYRGGEARRVVRVWK